MRLLFGHDTDVAIFVGAGLNVVLIPPYTTIGVLSDGVTDAGEPVSVLVGGMVFSGFNRSNIDMTVYFARQPRRGVIRAAAHYCFEQLGCNRVSATTRRANRHANVVIQKLGFKYEATRKQWFGPSDDDDGIAYVMTRENAGKWL